MAPSGWAGDSGPRPRSCSDPSRLLGHALWGVMHVGGQRSVDQAGRSGGARVRSEQEVLGFRTDEAMRWAFGGGVSMGGGCNLRMPFTAGWRPHRQDGGGECPLEKGSS